MHGQDSTEYRHCFLTNFQKRSIRFKLGRIGGLEQLNPDSFGHRLYQRTPLIARVVQDDGHRDAGLGTANRRNNSTPSQR